ncbi:hypothetical protein [Listeria monocytogenes]|uniref:hypothetical protein n=1 Tax=Listeria monocytogenes TaxID=1639 RepID=UPI000E724DCF|nr:hypothetical protein [Listeria monocytogenes]RJY80687.1 hypothetical protein DYZ37_02751 [Listeria monocytogenes]HAC3425340.1 hypothetical protein [Listeria monocytogenes]
MNNSMKGFSSYIWNNSKVDKIFQVNDRLWGDYRNLFKNQSVFINNEILRVLFMFHGNETILGISKDWKPQEKGLKNIDKIISETMKMGSLQKFENTRSALAIALGNKSVESAKAILNRENEIKQAIKIIDIAALGNLKDIENTRNHLSGKLVKLSLDSAKSWQKHADEANNTLKRASSFIAAEGVKDFLASQKKWSSSMRNLSAVTKNHMRILGLSDIVKDNSIRRLTRILGEESINISERRKLISSTMKGIEIFTHSAKRGLSSKVLSKIGYISSNSKDMLDKYSAENITFGKGMYYSLTDKEQVMNKLEDSVNSLIYAEANSYVLMPHQLVLLKKIINAYKSNNYFYIPFVAFSLIDSLFSDILKWIEEAAKHIEGYIRLNRSGGKGVKVTNFLYNFDFKMDDMDHMEIYSLFKVYGNLYSNYESSSYSGMINRHAIIHGDWEDVEQINKLEALKLMQFIYVMERNIDKIYTLFKDDMSLNAGSKELLLTK